ncbi:hypothetical protein HKBW3S43_00961 [Candidatus Hakubella thermalkaliphila]|uniref:Uncharacterized protein n=1 Tax=Candidatus Hakubella thermalkaliphila TaxID=2754717 RepID=A0A6V8PR87_9ACTN|nr:hypothetical protein [Candidatus Hakubella thermalkaliphila]GFP35169.1 hypothetical protein HKBW3S43_00961 [Candidatus Hakubella thermalkaliphila]
MSALYILLEKWELFLALIGAFAVGFVGGKILFILSKVKALEWAERLDSARKPLVKPLYKILHLPCGAFKGVMFIFGVNLTIEAFFHHTVGGILIVLPSLILALAGLQNCYNYSR